MRRILLAVVLLAPVLAVGPAARADGPCSGGSAGGEWRSYGGDRANSRDQVAETAIGPDNVADLQPAYSFSAVAAGGAGSFSSTPVIADGCLFVATSAAGANATVYAADATTGAPIWRADLGGGPTFIGGVFAPAVADGRVYVIAGQTIPTAYALDQQTGELLWKAEFPDLIHSTGANASAVAFDGMVFFATVGWDLILPFSRPSFYILDGETGALIKQTQVIPDSEYFDGTFRAGGGVWSTAAIDETTGYLYVGTANPYNRAIEHDRTNSIMKIDMDRTRETFGEVVGNYKGDPDYDPALYNTFQCQTLGEVQVVFYGVLCGQKDVDFGASPNLFRTSDGRVLVGDLQKSGVYHAVDADTMQGAWKAVDLAPPNLSGNASTSAVDEHAIYTATDQNRLYAIDKGTGESRLLGTFDGIGGYLPVSVANGVVYTMGGAGNLYAIDAATGEELLNVQLSDPSGACTGTSGAGVAVAGGMVYATCSTGGDGGGVVVAYTL